MNVNPNSLWKKESTESDSLFIDIFDGVRNMEVYNAINGIKALHQLFYVSPKSCESSLKYRSEGNSFFIRKEYQKAMEMYNKSLCFAKDASENISLACANRSACFMELKMYEECLIDIELAIQAGYPERLMAKLENRKAKSLAEMSMKGGRKALRTPYLSFDADNEIPNMAGILKFKYDDQHGRHIVTDRDIDVEQTIFIENPLVEVLINSEYLRCSSCFKKHLNLIACPKCASAMFCSAKCAKNPYHCYECEMFRWLRGEKDGYYRNILQSIVRLVLMGITLTSTLKNVDELMQMVADCISAASQDRPPVASDDTLRSKYETILQLCCYIPTKKDLYDVLLQVACHAYDLLLEHEEIRSLFSTIAHQRFLKHLVVHCSAIFKTNHLTLAEVNSYSLTDNSCVDTYALAVFNIRSFLNHACAPNVTCLTYDNVAICKAIAPIQKGEQLFIDYIQADMETRTTERRAELKDVFGFTCQCEMCRLPGETLMSNISMRLDFDFVYLERNFFEAYSQRNVNVLQIMKEKSKQFLRKRGRWQPCQELCIVQEYFRVLIDVLKDCVN